MFKNILLAFSMLFCVAVASAQTYPAKPNTLVNDYTNTLKPQDVQALETKLERFADSTSTQIAVVLIKTTEGHAIDDYGLGLAKAWGIGQKGKNNGVLLLAAIEDRKVTVQTGFGATGAIPESEAKRIISQDLIPHFKTDDYYGGIDIATTDIMNHIGGDYTNENAQQSPAQGQAQQQDQGQQQVQQDSGGVNIGAIVVVVIIVIVIIVIIRGRGNGGGGGGQIIGPRGGASPFWWFLGGTLFGNSLNNWGNNGGGGYDDGGSSGGDDGGSSGDSGGGDFGGFGGGDFGGDGSSGSW